MLILGSKTKIMTIVHYEFEFHELLEIFLVNQIFRSMEDFTCMPRPPMDYEAKLSAFMNRIQTCILEEFCCNLLY